LTAGADVQKDRIEVSVWAWAPSAESWLVEHFVLPGDTAGAEPWAALDLLMRRDFEHELGGTLQIRRIAVDSGFNTQFVYNWVRNQSPDRAMAVKGHDQLALLLGTPRAVDVDFGGRKMQQALQLWPVGVSIAKQELYGWLRQPPPLEPGEALPYGFMHFPEVDQEYFRQLTGEQMRPRIINGKTRYVWEKIHDRNEALDCRVYARVAASALGVERWPESYWKEIENALRLKKLDSPALSGQSAIKRRRSTYL
jgi:phage terminase large subunit GpA-like protein